MYKLIKYLVIILVVIGAIVAVNYYGSINSSGPAVGEVNVTINEGESVQKIGEDLLKLGLIKSKFFFASYIKQIGAQAKLQAGEYSFQPGLTMKEIVSELAAGDTVSRERAITIIEGWDIDQIDGYLAQNNIISAGGFSRQAKGGIGDWGYPFAKPEFLQAAPAEATLEGYLFPDTYRVFNDASADTIVEKMLNNFQDKVSDDMLAKIQERGLDLHEIIIMASIIEKEVKTPEDMAIVSGIFWRRIANGQPLQSDATLAYYTGEKKAQLTLPDTKIDTRYNTYLYPGLPPGPICSPGLNAIRAAVYPQASDYNYFLSRQDTGETIFSRTYEEHIDNKNKYLK